MDCVILLGRKKKGEMGRQPDIIGAGPLWGNPGKHLIICFAGYAVNSSIMADYSPSNENTTCQGN